MKFGSATLHEAAGQIGALSSAIKPIVKGMTVAGPAFTVKSPPQNNLWLHRAIAVASHGHVLVVDVGGHYETGYWGEIMTVAAQARGIAGLVVDGSVRDADRIAALGFPVFARGLSIRGTGKDVDRPGALNESLPFGNVIVAPGDLVVGDADGVVVIPKDRVDDVLSKSREREDKEAAILEHLRKGETTLDIYGWS